MIQIEPDQPTKLQEKPIYRKTNGCSRKPSCHQLTGLVLIFIIITLHANIIGCLCSLNNSILFIIMIFYFIVLIAIIIDYFQLLLSDPVDPRLLTPQVNDKQLEKGQIIWCEQCKIMTHQTSYHCKKCKRCVEGFDHHCKFVNNCIGKQNYSLFFRLVLSLITLLLLASGQGIWVATTSDSPCKQIGLILAVASGILILPLLYLCLFHCFIILWRETTTKDYIFQGRSGSKKHSNNEQRTQKGKKQPSILITMQQIKAQDKPVSNQIYITEPGGGSTTALKKQYLY